MNRPKHRALGSIRQFCSWSQEHIMRWGSEPVECRQLTTFEKVIVSYWSLAYWKLSGNTNTSLRGHRISAQTQQLSCLIGWWRRWWSCSLFWPGPLRYPLKCTGKITTSERNLKKPMELSTASCSIVEKRTRETDLSKIQKESSNEWAKEPRQYFLKEVQMSNKYIQKRAAVLAVMEMQT